MLAALCPCPTSPLFTIEASGVLMQMGVRYSVVRLMQRHCAFMLEHSRGLLPDFCYDEEAKSALRLQERLWLLRAMCERSDANWPTELLHMIACLMVEMVWLALFDTGQQQIPTFDPAVSYLWYDRVPAWYCDGIDSCSGTNNSPSYRAVLASHDYIDLKRKRVATTAMDMSIDNIEPEQRDDPNPAPQKKQKTRM